MFESHPNQSPQTQNDPAGFPWNFQNGSKYPSSWEQQQNKIDYIGTYFLLVICGLMFGIDHLFHDRIFGLYLNHNHPQWYQFITAMFCHFNLEHLGGNLFHILVFGKFVEEEIGTGPFLFSYFSIGILANLSSVVFNHKNIVSIGASGGIYGLYVLALFVKLYSNGKGQPLLKVFFRCIDFSVLAIYVAFMLISEVRIISQGTNINHYAHIFGILSSSLVMFTLMHVLPVEKNKRSKRHK